MKIDEINKRWIAKAVEIYNARFTSPIFRVSEIDPKKEVYVTVFGPTQGGKTTLILRLLGVKANEFDKVYKAIRAGIPEGSSCTKFATTYAVSDNNSYQVKAYDDRKAEPKNIISSTSLKDLSDALLKIRSGENQLLLKGYINIEIPADIVESEGRVNVRLVDLPGWDGRGDSKGFIKELYKKWIPGANCVLLVSQSEHLNSLDRFDSDNYPYEVRSWKAWASRYKVVLTRYAANKSEIEHWTSNEPDIVGVHKRMTEILSNPAKGIRDCPEWLLNDIDIKVYAFDFGKSWIQLNKENPEYADRIKPVMDEYIARLKLDIVNSSDTLTSLRAMCDMSEAFRELHKTQKEKLNVEIRSIDKKIKKENGKLEQLDDLKTALEDETKTLEEILEKAAEARQDINSCIATDPRESYSWNRTERLEEIRDDLSKAKGRLQGLLIEWNDAVKAGYEAIGENGVETNRVHIDTPDWRAEDINNETFYWVIKKQFKDYNRIALKHFRKAISKIINQECYQTLSNRTEDLSFKISENLGEKNMQIAELESNAKKIRIKLHETESSKITVKGKLTKLNADYKRALARAKELPQILEDQFRTHKGSIYRYLKKENQTFVDPNERSNTKTTNLHLLLSLYNGAKILDQIYGEQ